MRSFRLHKIFIGTVQRDLSRVRAYLGVGNAITLRMLVILLPVLLIRICYFTRKAIIISKIFQLILVICYRIEYSPKCIIKHGLLLFHPFNNIFGANIIGKNCTIYPGVIFGASRADSGYDSKIRPNIMANCTFGSRAIIYGGLVISNGSKISAGSIVK